MCHCTTRCVISAQMHNTMGFYCTMWKRVCVIFTFFPPLILFSCAYFFHDLFPFSHVFISLVTFMQYINLHVMFFTIVFPPTKLCIPSCDLYTIRLFPHAFFLHSSYSFILRLLHFFLFLNSFSWFISFFPTRSFQQLDFSLVIFTHYVYFRMWCFSQLLLFFFFFYQFLYFYYFIIYQSVHNSFVFFTQFVYFHMQFVHNSYLFIFWCDFYVFFYSHGNFFIPTCVFHN